MRDGCRCFELHCVRIREKSDVTCSVPHAPALMWLLPFHWLADIKTTRTDHFSDHRHILFMMKQAPYTTK